MSRSHYSLSFILSIFLHMIALMLLGTVATLKNEASSEIPRVPDVMTLSLVEDIRTDMPSSQNPDTASQPQAQPAPQLDFLRIPDPLPEHPLFSDPSNDALHIPKHPLSDLSPPPPTVVMSTPSELPDKIVMPKLSTPFATPTTTDPFSTHADSTGGIQQGPLIPPTTKEKTIHPKYPMNSRRRGEEGRTILDVLVSKEGEAKSVTLVASSGFKELDAAAKEAVLAAKFNPGERNGKVVEASARMVILFQLKSN